MKKRLLSLVLCLVMVFSLLPSFAMAADPEPAADPAGSVYAIGTPGSVQTNPETKSAKYVFYDTQGELYSFKDASGNTRSYQYVAEGGTLYYPGVPANSDNTLQNARFVGWWTKDGNDWGEQVLDPDTDTAGKTITGLTGTNAEIDLYARYESSYYLVYHTEASTEYRIVAKKLVSQNTDISLKDGDEWSVRYTPDNASFAFLGWAKTQNGGPEDVVDTVNLGSSQTTLDLYPVLVQAKWIHFEKNDKESTDANAAKGATASYTAPAAVQSGHTVRQDYANGLNVPTAQGYTFLGWWNDVDGTQWTNADGSFVGSVGNAQLTADVTLTAHWQANTVNYTIIVWKQQITDTVEDEANGTEQYDVEFTEVRQAPTGSEVTLTDYTNIQNGEQVTPDDVNYYDFTGFHHDTITPHDNLTATVAPDGSTTLNVYYNRNIVTINFIDPATVEYEAAADGDYYYYTQYSEGYYLMGTGPCASKGPSDFDSSASFYYGWYTSSNDGRRGYSSLDGNSPSTYYSNTNSLGNESRDDAISLGVKSSEGYWYENYSTNNYYPLYYYYAGDGYYAYGTGPEADKVPSNGDSVYFWDEPYTSSNLPNYRSTYYPLNTENVYIHTYDDSSYTYSKGSNGAWRIYYGRSGGYDYYTYIYYKCGYETGYYKVGTGPNPTAEGTHNIKNATTYTGLYEQPFTHWSDHSAYDWKDPDTGTGLVLLGAFKLPNPVNTNILLEQQTKSASNNKIEFFKQNVNGSYPAQASDSYEGSSNTFYITDKYPGYQATEYRTKEHSASTWTNQWTQLPAVPDSEGEYAAVTVGEDDTYYDLQIHFKLKSYTITYVDATNSDVLKNAESHLYTSDLTGYASTSADTLYYDASELPAVRSHDGKYFTGWYADSACTTRVFFQEPTEAQKAAVLANATDEQKNADGSLKYTVYEQMPMKNLVLYAGYANYRYRVWIQPNGGELSATESSYFNTDWGKVVSRYDDVEAPRDYAPDANGTWYYVIFDRPEDGVASRRWFYVNSLTNPVNYTDGNGVAVTIPADQIAAHVQKDSSGQLVTYKYLPNAYRFNGWYEVDGEIDSNTPPALTAAATNQYVFGTPVEENVAIRAEWVRDGIISVEFNAGEHGSGASAAEQFIYMDHSQGIAPSAPANIDAGWYFIGWKLPDGRIVQTNDLYDVLADYAVAQDNTEGKPKFVYTLTAQYASVEIPEAKLVYDANGGSGSLTDLGKPVSNTGADDVTGFVPGTNTLTKLPSNAPIVLSNGAGFTKSGCKIIGWNDDQQAANDGAVKFEVSETYGISGGTTTLYAVWAETTPATYLIDFGAQMKLAENGSIKKGSDTHNNGEFSIVNNAAVYQLKADETIAGGANLVMSGVDSATIHGNFYVKDSETGAMVTEAKAAWKDVTVVPASSVYFDDSFTAPITVGDGSGFNSELDGKNVNSTADPAQGRMTFTFYGTRADFYCTTTSTGQTVRSYITDSTGAVKKTVSMKNQSTEARYNVPTVSFDMGTPGNYTVTFVDIYGDYKIDGVRIYNSVSELAGTEEADAHYIKLHDKLVDGIDAMLKEQGKVEGIAFHMDNGSNDLADYAKEGPKNEIYLDTNEFVAFEIENFDAYTGTPKVMVGLSVQGAANGTVQLNGNDSQDVKSVVDEYYVVNVAKTGDSAGIVFIKNLGDERIAVTNLKITGVTGVNVDYNSTSEYATTLSVAEEPAAEVEVFEPKLVVTNRLLSFVQNPVFPEAETGAQEEPEPDPTPSFQDVIRQLLSSFVKALFGSISRLFGN